jgi:hypothetical protein
MRSSEFVFEKWSQKYKSSINCSHPKGFSQKAHCAGKNKQNESIEMEMVCETCGMCETHGNLNEIKKGQKDSNGYTKCWSGYHAQGTKKSATTGKQVRNCVPNESQGVAEGSQRVDSLVTDALRVMKGPDVSDAVLALKRVLGDRAYNERRGFYSFYVDQIHDMYGQQGVAEDLTEEFDLIESIIEGIAEHNGVDAEAVWEDLESLTEDELYAFAVTSQLNEDWQKANKRDKTDGMSQKAVNAYRRENPGSKLKTAVTTKPGKLKKGGKASKRRKSYCSRSRGQMKMHSISCAKTPDKAICKARRRWNC